MRTCLAWRRPYERAATGILRLRGQVQSTAGRLVGCQVGWLGKTRRLNALLVIGLVSINLVAFGTAYWWATRDILAEVTGEVVAEWMDGPNGSASAPNRILKRSSLSKSTGPISREPESELALPLPPPPMTERKSFTVRVRQNLPALTSVMDVVLASPSTESVPQKKEIQVTSAPKPASPRLDAQSP
jgi:hypothetical protein